MLFRLVDLASRTLEHCAPAKGHLATRYAQFLHRLADGIAGGPSRVHMAPHEQRGQSGGDTSIQLDGDGMAGNAVWDGNWLSLLQSSGLPDWPFDGEGNNFSWT